MAIRSAFGKVFRRGKCFLLVFLSLSVLIWISTFTGDSVKPLLSLASTKQTYLPEKKISNDLSSAASNLKDLNDSTQSHQCPAISPLLQGTLGLSFDPLLKLEDVEHDNKAVIKGEYQPSNCVAQHSVAILIPYRNREKHLLYFLHHLHPFLQRQQLHYGIYVIHQVKDETFNRAKLLNIGFLEAKKEHDWDCYIFHDVDLIPENDNNLYTCANHPKHLVVGRNVTGYRLRYSGYFGGVTALSKKQFEQVNGFSNLYWGWGGEDDDLRIRVEINKMKIVRPPAKIGRYIMVFHKRDSGNQANKNRMWLLRRTSKTWETDGLNSCFYELLSTQKLHLYTNISVDVGKPVS